VADFKSEWPRLNRNRWPTSFRNQWPTCSGISNRHSFRLIVAPEYGDRISDLREFTRDVMQQIEADLGTRLEWVVVDHFNTGHPHTQVVIRGQDDQGKDLIIAQDYITDGVRLRAEERATLELGPETDHERHVTGIAIPDGGIDWTFGRSRGLGL
jgi:hypothetical protein